MTGTFALRYSEKSTMDPFKHKLFHILGGETPENYLDGLRGSTGMTEWYVTLLQGMLSLQQAYKGTHYSPFRGGRI